jgi:DNA mismatch repair protein MutL
MGKIQQLLPHEAQKIAAGQVIDRPAHVVKELLENSIDAGASKITITIEDGGKKLIRISDNGCGMSQEDAQLCFQKHATSKITSIDQLISITSYGFRGEALASIAAVSKVVLRTKESHAAEGTMVSITDQQTLVTPHACPDGTDISISDLFYNMPARAKFLKKRETETNHIAHVIRAACLAHPEIHIIFEVDGTVTFNCPPQESIKDRFAQLWDHTTAQHAIEIDATHSSKTFSITGAISNHQWFRYDRSAMYFLVNNRWVMNHTLGRALLKGYNNVLPQGKYPMACIAIFINPSHVDINMHPRKEEVKFANPRLIEKLIEDTVRAALEKNLSKQIKREVQFATSIHPQFPSYMHEQPAAKSGMVFKPASSTSFDMQIPQPALMTAPPPIASLFETVPQQSHESTISILEKKEAPYTIIGQYHKTYILIEQEEGLFLIDQHAAHERVLYEIFANRFDQIPTINLMFPQLISLSADELNIIEPYFNIFAQHGITINRFSKDQLTIQSTPVHVKNISLSDLVKEVISWIQQEDAIDQEEFTKKINDKLRAQMACKAAVKAGDPLTHEQMSELLEDLYKSDNRFSCPHGRPTGWLLSLSEIEKKFRRKL